MTHPDVEEGNPTSYETLEQLIPNFIQTSQGTPENPAYRLPSIEVSSVFHPCSARSVYSAKVGGIL